MDDSVFSMIFCAVELGHLLLDMFGILHGMLSPRSAVLRCATCLRCVMSGRYFVISAIDTRSSNSKQDGMRSLRQSFSPRVVPADQSTTLSHMGLPFILLSSFETVP